MRPGHDLESGPPGGLRACPAHLPDVVTRLPAQRPGTGGMYDVLARHDGVRFLHDGADRRRTQPQRGSLDLARLTAALGNELTWYASTTCPAATSPPASTPTCSPTSSTRSRNRSSPAFGTCRQTISGPGLSQPSHTLRRRRRTRASSLGARWTLTCRNRHRSTGQTACRRTGGSGRSQRHADDL
jgi:hypothetical protein